MTIRDYIDPNCITFSLKAATKEEAFQEMAELFYQAGKIENAEMYIHAVKEREKEFTTGIGGGIAIPHGKSSTVKHACIAFGKTEHGIAWEALDDAPVTDIFMLAIPESEDAQHLDMLSTLARKLMHSEVKTAIHEATDTEAFYKAIE